MILERAIVQQTVVGRDGQSITRECPRPEHVRQMAHRVHRWKESREGCQLCQHDNAIAVRAGKAVCGLCSANLEIRYAAFDTSRKATVHRASDAADSLNGVAIVFNSLSVDLGGFFERIAPPAVDRTFAEGIDVIQLAHHNSEQPLARLSRGTLRIQKTTRGLENSFDPIDTTDGENMRKNVNAGNVSAQSFGFVVMPEGEDWLMEGDDIVRTVRDMRVFELSGVVWPAYRSTSLRYVDVASRAKEFEHRVRRAR